jgi:hypothetical protein
MIKIAKGVEINKTKSCSFYMVKGMDKFYGGKNIN